MILTEYVPEDLVIQHLPLALDVERIKPILQQRLLAQGSDRISHCEIERVKYKPGKNCLVCYRLEIQQPQTKTVTQLLLSARFYEKGGSHSRYLKANIAGLIAPEVGTALLHLSQWDCLIWVFPNDRKLSALPTLSSTKNLADTVIPGLIDLHWGNQWRFSRLQSERVHYLPEHTCCVRTQFTLKHRETGETRQPVLYGKTYYNDQGNRTMDVMLQLWRSPVCQQGRLLIPQPLSYLADYKMLWQFSVPGTPVLDRLRQDRSFVQRMDEVAATIAALHQSVIIVERQQTREQLCQRMIQVSKLVSRVSPDLSQPLQQLVAELLMTDDQADSRPTVILHGDLHLKNMLADEQHIYLIDLDDVHRGDPLQDLGSLIASLLSLSLAGQFDREQAHALIRQLLFHYQQHIDWAIEARSVCWHVATALINERVMRSISRLKSGRLEHLPTLMMLAADIARGENVSAWTGDLQAEVG